MKRIIYLFIGLFSLVLGVIGVAFPILPTTPFIMLSLYSFARSSKRLENWLLNTKLYNKYAKNFIDNKSMTLKAKLSILLPVSAMLLVAIYFSKPLYAKILILLLMISKYSYFFIVIKTEKRQERIV